MLIKETLILPPFRTRCYIIGDTVSGLAVVIDPASRGKNIYEKLKSMNLGLTAILLTHGHFDHIGGVDELAELTGARVYVTDEDSRLLHDADLNASNTFHGRDMTVRADTCRIKDGDVLAFGDIKLRVKATPGHTGGSVCFIGDDEIYTGDTVFENDYGRTDLPTGSAEKLAESIKSLESELVGRKIMPGH